MAINPTASLKNINSSIRKYFDTALETNHSIPVYFDQNVFEPSDEDNLKWITIKITDTQIKPLSVISAEVFVCAKGDTQGIVCEELYDLFIDVATDENQFKNVKRIPLYDTSQNPWNEISAIMIENKFPCSGTLDGPQGVKFNKINVTMRVPSLV